MKRTVTITLSDDDVEVPGDWMATCTADGEEWAKVHSGDQHTVIDQVLHYARVHLSDPPMPFGNLVALREISSDYDPDAGPKAAA